MPAQGELRDCLIIELIHIRDFMLTKELEMNNPL